MSVLLPIFAVIFLGVVFKRTGFLTDAFWPHAEKATYYVFFPCLLIGNLSTAHFGDYAVLPMSGAIVTGLLSVSALALFVRRWLPIEGAAFSSLFQGSIRMNTYVGIAGASALAGSDGVTLSAIAIIATVPLVNVLCVTVLAHMGTENSTGGVWRVLRSLISNPLIVGCAVGIFLNAANTSLPPSVFEVVHILGRAALPLGLLAVGAGLAFSHMLPNALALSLSCVFKLALLPSITALACVLYDVPDSARVIAVLFTALPTATSSYILARQMGGDHRVMAGIITVQTLLAMATWPLATLLLG